MLTMVSFMMIVIIVLGAMAVDVAYVQLVNMQLRKATDAAAHAGAEALARTQDSTAGIAAAKAVALQNTVLGSGLILEDSDVQLGTVAYFNGQWEFQSSNDILNAVRVTSSIRPNGYVTTLGQVAGVDNINVSQSATAANVTRDICLVLDRSGSMAFDLSGVDWSYPSGGDYCTRPDQNLSRWAAMLDAVDVFIGQLEDTDQSEQLALVTYSTAYSYCGNYVNESDIDRNLTYNYSRITRSLRRRGRNPIIGGTAISAGIDDGVDVLTDPNRTRRFANKMLVLLTDGHENAGRSSLDAADDAADQNVTIHTITFSTGADEARMTEVANRTGGQHFHAPDEDTLIAIFQEIARGIPIVMTD